jgi:hypothetical protein
MWAADACQYAEFRLQVCSCVVTSRSLCCHTMCLALTLFICFPCCLLHSQAFVRSVAALYGVRASAQGGSSSGRTCLVLASTPDTAPPAATAAAAAAQLQALLTAELTREVTAAAVAAGTEQQRGAAAGGAGQQVGNGRQRERRCGSAYRAVQHQCVVYVLIIRLPLS